jgi:selenocysteine lyase/cysteine desulfurase
MTVEGFDCEELATALDREFAIAARAGLTCAPLAHRTLGTEKSGVLRLSVGATSSEQDIDEAVRALTLLCSRQSPN